MFVTNLAQTLEIANRRYQCACRAGNRLNKNSCDSATAIGLANTGQIFRQLCPGCRLTFGKGLFRGLGVAHGNDIGQGYREGLPVFDHTGQRYTAHIHPVIGPLAADKTQTLGLAICPVIGHDDLHRGFNRFRT